MANYNKWCGDSAVQGGIVDIVVKAGASTGILQRDSETKPGLKGKLKYQFASCCFI